ncbi:LysR family transcriptional regulator, partial [Salmonella enterica]|nr:LysR family transcriptional regulator [Salmonella enterica]
TINIMNQSSLKKKFIIYSPQLLITQYVMKLVEYIRKDSQVEIEHHDILTTDEQPEDLLAYRKADIVVSMAPLNNRSIVCTHFNKVECILACSENHPRLGETATIDEILQESFTQFVARENDIKEHHSLIHNMLGERIIGFRSKSLITIANAISATELIGFLPQSLVDYYSSTIKLKKITIPFTIAPIQL